MGTIVTMQVLRPNAQHAMDRAFQWFREIEKRCTRFDPSSELMQLTTNIGAPVPVSNILFEAVRVALLVAEASNGAFDPTLGRAMQQRGFHREYRTGEIVNTPLQVGPDVSYRDVILDPKERTITLLRPLLLDLGAVAKGMAVDEAANELAELKDFAIDAGGDLYLGGNNPQGEPWSIGIRHPRVDRQWIETLRVSNKAVCTSGDYEHPDHILDPQTHEPARSAASVTVVAPTAILADALATAVFALGPDQGVPLLEQLGLEGLIYTPTLERFTTASWMG